jgi:adenosine deaminase
LPHPSKFPPTFQTDDYGVFKTCLSNEIRICAETFKLRKIDVINLSKTANKYSFASDLERQMIAAKLQQFLESSINE